MGYCEEEVDGFKTKRYARFVQQSDDFALFARLGFFRFHSVAKRVIPLSR